MNKKIEEFEKKFYAIECVTPGNEFVLDVFVAKRSEVIASVRSLLTDERERVVKLLEGMKKYSGGHNAAHTWIENGYCHGCRAKLNQQQLEEVFGWNDALDEAIKLIQQDE